MISNSTATSMTTLQTSVAKPGTTYIISKKNMKKIRDGIEELASAIDAAEMYQYNIKIVDLPQTTEQESSEATAALCLKLFEAMGVEGICITDLYISHRVPRRRRSNEGASNGVTLNSVICKFTRRKR